MKLPLRRIISMRRSAAENGTVQITAAGDLCLEEDGYVLDYYDTVNDLSKCISKTILDQTNAADLFFLNHEYCVSDRGARWRISIMSSVQNRNV